MKWQPNHIILPTGVVFPAEHLDILLLTGTYQDTFLLKTLFGDGVEKLSLSARTELKEGFAKVSEETTKILNKMLCQREL